MKRKLFWKPEFDFYLVNLFGLMQVTWIRSIYDWAGDTGASKKPFSTVPNDFLTKEKFFWKPESVFCLNSLFGPRKVSWIRTTSFLEGDTNASKNRSVRYRPVFYCCVKWERFFGTGLCVLSIQPVRP